MEADRELCLHQKVELEVVSNDSPRDDSGKEIWLEARVVRLQRERIWLESVQPENQWRILEPGLAVRLKFCNDSGIFFSDTEVLEAGSGNTGSIAINKPARFLAIQRREFFRLKLEVPFAFCVVESPEEPLARKPIYRGVTTDISGGGLKFITTLPLEPGALLVMQLVLEGAGKIRTLCHVIRCTTLPAEKTARIEVGAVFLMLEEKFRSEIIRHVFRKQQATTKDSTDSA